MDEKHLPTAAVVTDNKVTNVHLAKKVALTTLTNTGSIRRRPPVSAPHGSLPPRRRSASNASANVANANDDAATVAATRYGKRNGRSVARKSAGRTERGRRGAAAVSTKGTARVRDANARRLTVFVFCSPTIRAQSFVAAS